MPFVYRHRIELDFRSIVTVNPNTSNLTSEYSYHGLMGRLSAFEDVMRTFESQHKTLFSG